MKTDTPKRKRRSAVLALTLDGSRLEGVVLRRTNGSLTEAERFGATLTLDPLADDPELVGREILNHIESAGARERNCVVGIPPKWVLTASVAIPAIPETEVADFIQTAAERGFPCDPATLRVAASRYADPAGARFALLAGVPLGHMDRLDRILRAAKLHPQSITLGSAALQPAAADAGDGTLAVVVGDGGVSLQLTCGGGIAAVRTLEGVVDGEAGQRRAREDLVARECRITLGQLPPALGPTVKRLRIFGPQPAAAGLEKELRRRFASPGMAVETVEHYAAGEFGVRIPSGAAVSAPFSLAARYLAGQAAGLEFLETAVPAWRRIMRQFASGKMQAVTALAAAILLAACGTFGVQYVRMARLEARWAKMRPAVENLENLQRRIRQFRPWFDDSLPCLTILRVLTKAFPEDGVVTARSVEIRGGSAVTCSGTARDNTVLLQVLNRLRATAEVRDVKLGQVRGTSPMQFTFEFHYGEEAQHEK